MGRFACFILSLVFCLALINSAAQQTASTVPNLMRYGGVLKDSDGELVISRVEGVTFAIYKQQEGGAPLWLENQNVATDASGRYSVLLGSAAKDGIPPDLFVASEERWLGVSVQGQKEQTRVLLVSVPYAFKAQEAETLGGLPASAFLKAGSDQGFSESNNAPSNQGGSGQPSSGTRVGAPTNGHGTKGYIAMWFNQLYLGNSNLFQDNAGRVGIGTLTPNSKLDVAGDVHISGNLAVDNPSFVVSFNNRKGAVVPAQGDYSFSLLSGTLQGAQLSGTYGQGVSLTNSSNAFSGTFTGNGAALTGIQFSQLGGSLMSSQFSGTYGNAVTLSNPSNVFYGNGANLTGIVAGPGSPYYIQNGTAQQGNANFNISGNGTLGGTLSANGVNAASSYLIGGSAVLGIGKPADQNLFIGFGAGANNVGGTGKDNLFVGYQAGYNNTTGYNNVYSGYQAGYNNTTGIGNVFTGLTAGYSTINGIGNVFTGYSAGYLNTSGNYNSFTGANAGDNNSGSYNIFNGYQAGTNNTTGGSNIYIGNVGCKNPCTESNAIRIGTQGSGDQQQNATYIAGIYGNSPSQALPVVINEAGELGTTTQGIGVTSFNTRTGAVVPVQGDYGFALLSGTLQDAQLSGTYGQGVSLTNASNAFTGRFTGDGSGLANVNAATLGGYGPNGFIQNGTAQQGSANFNISGNGSAGGTLSADTVNAAATYQIGGSGVLSIGMANDDNLFIGIGAGANNVGGSGQFNVFSGSQAGYSNTTGRLNTFTGEVAGYSNATGSYNAFTGTAAGSSNTTGSYNVFTGTAAGGSSTGSYNTYTGAFAGQNNTTGSSNIYLGNYGCPFPCTESNTIRIGTPGNGDGEQNAAYIAGIYGNSPSQALPVVINAAGQLGTTSQGIGVTSFNGRSGAVTSQFGDYVFPMIGGSLDPSQIPPGSQFYIQNGQGHQPGGFDVDTGALGSLNAGNAFVNQLQAGLLTANNGLIQGQLTSYYLLVEGPLQAPAIPGTQVCCTQVYVGGDGTLGVLGSSRRFKEQIADMGAATSKLFQLRPVTFLYKPQYDDGSHLLQYGLIAEEVAKVYPEMVAYDKDGQPYTVKYHYLAPMLLNELQKQHAIITSQQELIQSQHSEMTQLRNEQTRLQDQVTSLQYKLEQQRQEFEQRLSRIEASAAVRP